MKDKPNYFMIYTIIAFISLPFLLLWVFFTCLGCASVSKALDNYKACQGDQVCMSEMTKVKDRAYVVAKASSSGFPLPSVAEIIAVAVSNVVSFGYGVFHGKKKT